METVFTKMTENQAKLEADIYPTTNPGYTTKISYIDEITTEKNTLRDKYTSFASDVQKIQSPKYTFEICFLAIFILLSIVGIIGYWSRREWIPWAMSFLLLCFTVPVLYVIGLETTYAFLSIDFCQTIGNSITSGITPTDTKGLGTYFSCPSKETARSINTAIYELSTSFNVIADELNQTLVAKGDTLGNGKRNNTRFEELKANYTDNATIISGLNNLVLTNNILAGLLYMSSCATADNTINYIEEQFCYPLVDYMQYNILFNFIGVIGLLVLGIGLNKLIMIMRKNATTALRGNKKLNNEDDDDL